MRSTALPVPDDEALAASARLCARIAARIGSRGGWIGFDEYMDAALYEPGLGYYGGGSRKFGAQGDFVTAPEISPLFGACLAAQCAQWFAHVPRRVVEFGAGSGALAAQLIPALALAGFPEVEYSIVELSGELRARQRDAIARAAPGARVCWLDGWPASIDGVAIANEVLDAIPARVFRWRDGEVLERGVALAPADAGAARFAWADREADEAFARRVRETLGEPIADAGPYWPDEYVSEVGERACAWVADAGRRLGRGALLLLDYGFPAREYYHPQRSGGTLMCHYRHRAHGDPFVWPGLQDVTVHVDFSAVARSALSRGLDVLGYSSQANFLLNLGLLERFSQLPAGDALERARASQAVQRLIGDAEMGEIFKALAIGRGLPDDALGFSRADRRHRL